MIGRSSCSSVGYGNFDPAMPLGGSQMSGWGKELSRHSIDEYVHVKGVWINTGS
jgi:aldehyde dehydrogenase (NAD+)